RAVPRLARANGVSRMIEDQGAQTAAGITKSENGQFRIEGAGRPDEVIPWPDPVNHPVREQHPAVLAHSRLCPELKVKLALLFRKIGVGVLDRFDDPALHTPRKSVVQTITVDDTGARRVMSVGAVDQNVCGWNAGGLFDLGS